MKTTWVVEDKSQRFWFDIGKSVKAKAGGFGLTRIRCAAKRYMEKLRVPEIVFCNMSERNIKSVQNIMNCRIW